MSIGRKGKGVRFTHPLFLLFILNLFVTSAVWGEEGMAMSVENVMLSQDVVERNPQKVFSPPAYCEKDKNGKSSIPVVNSSRSRQVVVWTKISSTISGAIRHTWHHQIDNTWNTVTSVKLTVRPSSGYRTWSLRTIRPDQDKGEWMVVMAPSEDPDHVLCITRFTIK